MAEGSVERINAAPAAEAVSAPKRTVEIVAHELARPADPHFRLRGLADKSILEQEPQG